MKPSVSQSFLYLGALIFVSRSDGHPSCWKGGWLMWGSFYFRLMLLEEPFISLYAWPPGTQVEILRGISQQICSWVCFNLLGFYEIKEVGFYLDYPDCLVKILMMKSNLALVLDHFVSRNSTPELNVIAGTPYAWWITAIGLQTSLAPTYLYLPHALYFLSHHTCPFITPRFVRALSWHTFQIGTFFKVLPSSMLYFLSCVVRCQNNNVTPRPATANVQNQ